MNTAHKTSDDPNPDRQASAGFVNGEWITSDATWTVRNPATGRGLAEIGYADAAMTAGAMDAAEAAFHGWAHRTNRDRADLLLRAADEVQKAADFAGRLLSDETGKSRQDALAEFRSAAEWLRWYAEECRRPTGSVAPGELPGRKQLTARRPIGVVVCLTAWNYPVSGMVRKVAPALAAGCTVVCRTSEEAPLAVVEFIECLNRAGLPAGVVNLVHGPPAEISEAMLGHPAARAVSFTGSTRVGRLILQQCAPNVVRPLLELGGNAPFIVFPDADIDAAVDGALVAKFRNNGESCIAANRFYVHEDVYDAFTQQLAKRVDDMIVGDPADTPTPDLGPLINDDRVAAVEDIVTDALARGGKCLTRKHDCPSIGSFYPPVLIENAPEDSRIGQEEIFGPVAGVYAFTDIDDVITRANATTYGLAAYAFTRSSSTTWRMFEELDAGIIGCNTALPATPSMPLGGVKQSGLGREGSNLGLEDFQETHYLSLQLDASETR